MLKESMEKFGDLSGIVHDLNSDEIIGGNQRFRQVDLSMAAVENVKQTKTGTVGLGYVEFEGESFSYRQVKWTPEQCEQANIVANKLGGTWDMDILANEFEMEDLLSWGFEPFEFGVGKNKFDEDIKLDGVCPKCGREY